MLTNCKNCKFFGKSGCAVKPAHWLVWDVVNRNKFLIDETKQAISAIAQSCGEFEEADDLKAFSATVSLSLRVWRKIAKARKDEERDSEWLPLIDIADRVIKEAGETSKDNDIPDFG
jgi:hypothetical protein